ncbi:Transforming acidic coiled-coil-containing protein 3 [Larimichthys crocea]|uniref:Uncharacterized protein n=1 Tax=Larimichthys crocea TaxID=215358 RepID=A0ACD3RPB6_LARCR|nr:Transforming acidic coiled-coil-containing protein 3 [Larimichthys crocea]
MPLSSLMSPNKKCRLILMITCRYRAEEAISWISTTLMLSIHFRDLIRWSSLPARPAAENPPTLQTEPQHTKPENTAEEPTKIESALDETLPFTPSVENSLVDASTDISSTESSVVTVVKVPAFEELDSCTATPDEKQPAKSVDEDKMSGSFVEDAPLPVKGAYNLDFDNLDAINPFQTGGSKIENSPVLGRKVPDNNLPVKEMQIKENIPTNVADVAQEVPVQPEVKPVVRCGPNPS